jgi:hypothetical protein
MYHPHPPPRPTETTAPLFTRATPARESCSLPFSIAPCRDRHSSCSPGPVTHCRDRLVAAPCRDARARRRSLDARNTQETEEHQLAAGGDQAAAERVRRWRSGGGRASVLVEIRRRPSVCTGRDHVAAKRPYRSRSGGGRAGAPVEIRPLRWQAGACSLLVALASRCSLPCLTVAAVDN